MHAVVEFEDINIASRQDSFAAAVREAMDSVNESIHESVKNSESQNQWNDIQGSLPEKETVFKTDTAGHNDAGFSDKKVQSKGVTNKQDGTKTDY